MASIITATAGQRITAAWLNANNPQAWVACTLNNSWANGGIRANLQVRFETAVSVRMIGSLAPGTLTGATQFATLPASGLYAPLSQLIGFMGLVAGTGVGTTVPFWIYPSGHIGLMGGTTLAAATEVDINCVYPLDA